MANPAEAIETIFAAKRTTLEQRLATAIQEKMRRNDDVSQNFAAPPLWLTIEINNTTNAKIGFHVGDHDAGPPSSELIDVDLRILEQLAEATNEPTMATRICCAVLSLRTGHPAEEAPNLLSTICSNIRPNAIKLQLTGEETIAAASVRNIVEALGAGHLRELETLAICGSDIKAIGGNDTIKEVYKAIADHHEPRCAKLQTLILDFTYPISNGKDEDCIYSFLKFSQMGDPNLGEALTVVVPKATLTIDDPSEDNHHRPLQADMKIRFLGGAVCHGNLKCLKLNFRVTNRDLTRSQLDDILQGLREDPPGKMVKDLKIEHPAPDSNAAVDAEGNVETIRHVIWQNTEKRQMQQRIELTHRGPKDGEGEEAAD